MDVAKHHRDIKRMFLKHFGAASAAYGYDTDDVLQEVYLSFIRKDRTPSDHNPTKSSAGHYMYMVIRSAFLHYMEKQKNKYKNEQVGTIGGDGYSVDAATVADTIPTEEVGMDIDALIAVIIARVGDDGRRRWGILSNKAAVKALIIKIIEEDDPKCIKALRKYFK